MPEGNKQQQRQQQTTETTKAKQQIKGDMMIDDYHAPADNYGSPSSWFVFVVGHCEEWPENRVEQGDIGLCNAYVEAGVPANQIHHVKDDHCTKTNCKLELESFLSNQHCNQQQRGTTLVFYYGGHGTPSGFETIQEGWDYDDVCKMIDILFQGDRVLFLLDCCASGNLCHYIPHNTNKQYVCLANTAPYVRASDEGEEWVLNNSWIHALRTCREQSNNPPPSLALIMELLADKNALKLGDQFFSYVSPGVDCQAVDWMPTTTAAAAAATTDDDDDDLKKKQKILDWPRLQHHIPPDGRVITKYVSIGDPVFYKHPGGMPLTTITNTNCCGAAEETEMIYIPPGWLPGTIVAAAATTKSTNSSSSHHDHDNNSKEKQEQHPTTKTLMPEGIRCDVKVEYWNAGRGTIQWMVEDVPCNQLMNGIYMAQTWMLPEKFEQVQVELAKSFKYIDCSMTPSTIVQVTKRKAGSGSEGGRGFDGAVAREAIILDWRDYDYWDELDAFQKKEGMPFGGYVPVLWTDDNTTSLIPTQQIQSTQEATTTTTTTPFLLSKTSYLDEISRYHSDDKEDNKSRLEELERKAMILSIESCGKSICNAKIQLGGCTKLKAYWPEDDRWYDAVPLDPETISLETLANHAQFALKGLYCPLLYEDGESALSPLYYVRRKRKKKRRDRGICCRGASCLVS